MSSAGMIRHRRRIASLALIACGLATLYFVTLPAEHDILLALNSGDYRLAARQLEKAAEQGNPAALNKLANLRYLGLGVTQNYEIAAQLYFDAAQQGFADAQLNLGNLYQQGLGVAPNPMRAFAWYRQSENNGQPLARRYLTQITVEYRIGPLQIEAAAKQWSRLDALVDEGL